MILNRTLPTSGDDDDVGDTCRYSFFDKVLYDWLIHDGKHFFRLCFGGWQKAGSKTRCWYDTLTNFLHVIKTTLRY